MGKLFKRIKDKLMGGFILKFLAGIYEKFKAANPKIAAAIGVIALGLQFGFDGIIESALAPIGIVIDLPPGLFSLDYLLSFVGHPLSDKATDVILMVLALLAGSKSTEFLEPDVAEEKLDKAKERVEARKERKAAKAAQ